MRTLKTALLLALALISSTAAAQTRTFCRDGVDFVLELPCPAWQVVSRIDVHDHVEFMNGNDPANGYLRLRKNLVDAGTTPADLFRRDEKWSLQSLPGYVVCKACGGEKVEGELGGLVFSYEYSGGGRPMAGRVYYLVVDGRTIYTLHFTGGRDQLQKISGQMDSMARSFRLK